MVHLPTIGRSCIVPPLLAACAATDIERKPSVKIAVCVKEVPDATAVRRIDPGTLRLDRSGERTLNPFDAHAVEEALRLKEGPAGADSEVVVICMGPETAIRTLGKALSLGADRAVLITDPSLAGADISLTAKVLAAALEREAPDLVLLGQQAADSESYVMAAAVADRLQRPLVTQVAQLSLDGETIRAKRQTETGYDVIEAPLPAVVSVADSINDPRYPSLKAIMGAKKKPQETLSAADLGISDGPRTEVLALSSPPAKAGGVRIEDEGGSSAAQIVEFLVERKVI
jgi:electron transfer flavoprotein beta subunit